MYDYDVYSAVDFIVDVFFYILNFISDNKVIFSFVLIPVVVSVIFIVIDFIFDVRDNFTEFKGFNKDTQRIIVNYHKNKKKQKQLDMKQVHEQSKTNMNYKHNQTTKDKAYYQKMEKYYFKKSVPKKSSGKYKNLDVDVE